MAGLSFDGVEKRYGAVQVLHRVDLQVADGEFIVLVGPSGCGKSTLLRCIAGLEEITGGELRIDGRTVNDVAPKDRDVAMVFQSYALYPHMTVRENMSFALQLQKHPETTTRVDEAAKMLGLSHLLDRFPRELSGGQRQRVAIARALVTRPEIVLADEPTANLDSVTGGSIIELMRDLNRADQTTFIFSTHDHHVMKQADRVVTIQDGVVNAQGLSASPENGAQA